jgi:hypothetical protein
MATMNNFDLILNWLAAPSQANHLDAPVRGGGTVVDITGRHKPVDEADKIAIGLHHPFREVGQCHAALCRVELVH